MKHEFLDVGSSYIGYQKIFLAPRMSTSILTLIGMVLLGSGCTSENKSEVVTTSEVTTHSAERGRTIYQTQCIACHNPDPHKPGSIGPDVFGSSRELLEARIMNAGYPPGYKPKRTSHSMAPLRHLKNEIDSIHDYLNQ